MTLEERNARRGALRDAFNASPEGQAFHLNAARGRLHRMLRLFVNESEPVVLAMLEEDIRDLLAEYPALADEEYVLC